MSDEYWQHEYIGGRTRDGLPARCDCHIVRKWAGGYKIKVPGDKRSFIVPVHHVRKKDK